MPFTSRAQRDFFSRTGRARMGTAGGKAAARRRIDGARNLAAQNLEIVHDEQVGQLQIALQTHEQVERLRLNGDVERRRRLVGD